MGLGVEAERLYYSWKNVGQGGKEGEVTHKIKLLLFSGVYLVHGRSYDSTKLTVNTCLSKVGERGTYTAGLTSRTEAGRPPGVDADC